MKGQPGENNVYKDWSITALIDRKGIVIGQWIDVLVWYFQ